MCENSSKKDHYGSTLVASAQIILLFKMLKFSKHTFFKESFCEGK
jgi:hypothetical protein